MAATITASRAGIVLHKGVFVDTVICGTTYAAEDSLCAFCDGTRQIICPDCEGNGILFADNVVDEDCADCSTCKGNSTVRCPQASARWCHE